MPRLLNPEPIEDESLDKCHRNEVSGKQKIRNVRRLSDCNRCLADDHVSDSLRPKPAVQFSKLITPNQTSTSAFPRRPELVDFADPNNSNKWPRVQRLKASKRTPPATIAIPDHSRSDGRSPKNVNANTATRTRLSLSTGATLDASPILSARK